MRHFRPEELIDLVEREAAPEVANDGRRTLRHLAECEVCRRRVSELRATMAAAREASVPEPSPLFWEHLSARVRERVASERSSSLWSGLESWRSRRVFAPVAALAAVVLVAVVAARLRPYQSGLPSGTSVSGELSVPSDSTTTVSDPSLRLLADLAEVVDWDEAAEAGFGAGGVAVDRAVADLSDPERVELQRLLKEEIFRSGV